jgi:hypothetical protein
MEGWYIPRSSRGESGWVINAETGIQTQNLWTWEKICMEEVNR